MRIKATYTPTDIGTGNPNEEKTVKCTILQIDQHREYNADAVAITETGQFIEDILPCFKPLDHLPDQPQGLEFLYRELQATQEREVIFKQMMMKAESQAHLMRRFIKQHGRQTKFAQFVLKNRNHTNPDQILLDFAFTT